MLRRFLLSLSILGLVTLTATAADENPFVTKIKSMVKDPSKPVAFVIVFKVKAGEEKKFSDAFGPAVAATRKEPGCVAYTLHRDADNPSQFAMYEQFKNVNALEVHAKEKYVEKLLGTIVPLLDGEPKISVYSVVE